MLVTPISSLLNAHGKCEKGDSWNVHCMSTITPKMTAAYNFYYQYSFGGLLIFGILLSALRIRKFR